MQKKEYSVDIDGTKLTAEFTDLAENSQGSVLLRYGDTVILVTAVMGEETREGLGYFPLSVEFEERFYAAGQILGSRFVRREGRPSDEAVLSGRMVDRTIRPLFDSHIRNDVQVVVTVLALGADDPDVLAIVGASLALAVSEIPWGGPVGAVRVGKRKSDGSIIINPTYLERERGELSYEVLACGKDGTINMIETAGEEVSEADITHALEKAREIHGIIEQFQKDIAQEMGVAKRDLPKPEVPEDLKALFESEIAPRMYDTVFSGAPGKASIYKLKKEWKAALTEKLPEADTAIADDLFDEAINDALHEGALKGDRRADGRGMDEIRPLFAQAGGISSMLHGSGIFYRGGTHIFSALTLGGPQDSMIVDTMEERDGEKHFMHHYNFPPFSVGETGRVGGFNRRMVGHGALAEKALVPVIPSKEKFPYTIRLVSETLSSNGSSSMGSVCASTLALMDGGVPITRPVAGIASGLIMDEEGNYKILTDIQGPEDEHGDMDFKVAGTREGITAIQMDVKVGGVPIPALTEALDAAKRARLAILDVMEEAISSPRAELSPRAPRIEMLQIKPEQIGLVIGSGGKTINEIKDTSGVDDITIEDDGSVYVTGSSESVPRAIKEITELTREYHAGERFEGEVTRILDFGAFVKIGRNAEGLVHVSEIAPFRVEKVTDILSVGDRVPVVIKEIDEKDRINLSIKAADPDFATNKGEGHKNEK